MNPLLTVKGHVPRWMVPLFLLPAALLVHVLLPRSVARLSPRLGWSGGCPRLWHEIALIPIGISLAGVIWGLITHFMSMPDSVQLNDKAQYFMQKGVYRYSRNPMYLAEVILWLAWALYYGSISVLIGAAGWWVMFNYFVIPSEERALEARFGEDYREYTNTVPRWFALIPVTRRGKVEQ